VVEADVLMTDTKSGDGIVEGSDQSEGQVVGEKLVQCPRPGNVAPTVDRPDELRSPSPGNEVLNELVRQFGEPRLV